MTRLGFGTDAEQTAETMPSSPTQPPWMSPAPPTVELYELANALVASKGVRYGAELRELMLAIEGET